MFMLIWWGNIRYSWGLRVVLNFGFFSSLLKENSVSKPKSWVWWLPHEPEARGLLWVSGQSGLHSGFRVVWWDPVTSQHPYLKQQNNTERLKHKHKRGQMGFPDVTCPAISDTPPADSSTLSAGRAGAVGMGCGDGCVANPVSWVSFLLMLSVFNCSL